MVDYQELLGQSQDIKDQLRDNFSLRCQAAIDKLLANYEGRGLRVQDLSRTEHSVLLVHLPTKIQKVPDSPGQVTASTDNNIAETVRRVAYGTAQAYDLKAEVDGPRFAAGGIYISVIRLEEKILF